MTFWKRLTYASLLCAVAVPVMAQPELRVTDAGLNGGNQLWLVEVKPDQGLLGAGGSVAVELDFTATSAVVAATADSSWNNAGANPGNNPFTGTVTEGIVTAGSTVFAALGSDTFTPLLPSDGDGNSSGVVDLADFSTLGTNWLQNVAGGPADGDYNSSGTVDLADFSTLGTNWLRDQFEAILTIETTGAGGTLSWGGALIDLPPGPGGEDFDYTTTRIAQGTANFDGATGSLALGIGSGLGVANVPEPSSIVLLVMAGLLLAFARRK